MADEHEYEYSPVSPYIMVHDGNAALEFYKRAFDAKVRETYPHEGKVGHATIAINGGDIMLSDEFPEHVQDVKSPRTLGGTTTTISLAVDDADKWFERAKAAGAEVTRPIEDQFYGRMGKLRDPFGHTWSIVGPKKS